MWRSRPLLLRAAHHLLHATIANRSASFARVASVRSLCRAWRLSSQRASLVACQQHWPCNWLTLDIQNVGVGTFQKQIEYRGIVNLTSGEVKVKCDLAVAQEMEFCGKTAARAA